MTLGSTTRVVRGGRALETVYWHYAKGKMVKHGKMFVYPRVKKNEVSQPPNIADQALKKMT